MEGRRDSFSAPAGPIGELRTDSQEEDEEEEEEGALCSSEVDVMTVLTPPPPSRIPLREMAQSE